MAVPVLKPNSTWFTPTLSTITRSTITSINFLDTYTPSETVTDSWDASVAQDGGIMCYVEGTDLTIAGNGSGRIMANADSSWVFCDINKSDFYNVLTEINGIELLDTSNATNMGFMFARIGAITKLDLRTFNVSNVTNMQMMFSCSGLLEDIKVSNWDTSACTSLYSIFDRVTALETIDISQWDTSSVTNMSYLFNGCTSLTSIDLSNWDTSACTTFFAMFQNCSALQSLDVSKWNTSNVTNMGFAFYSCDGLTTLAVDEWDVRNVKVFDHTFAHSNNLKLNVSKWIVTNKCTHLNCMFHSNANTYLDVSGFDTSGVISMYSMFEANSVLEKIDGLQNFDTSNCHAFEEMFSGCYALKEVDLSSWDTSLADADTSARSDSSSYKSQCTKNMFAGCRSLEKVILGENFTFAGDGTAASTYHGTFPTPSSAYITNADGNWYAETGEMYTAANIPNLTANTYYAYPASVLMTGSDFRATIPSTATSVIFTETAPDSTMTLTNVGVGGNSRIVAWLDGTTYYVYCQEEGEFLANEDCSYMFSGKTALKTINTGPLNTSNTTTMEYMFGHTGAMNLTSIIFGSNFNTSKVTSFLAMFRNCRIIPNLDVSNFNTSSATTMERMFDRCQKLQSIDCSNFDTSKVTSMYCMFQVNYVITSIGDVSNWNLSSCTSTRNMLKGCNLLASIDVSNWDMSAVIDASSMFSECNSLTELNVANWDVSNCTNLNFLFNKCSSVTELNVSNWNVSKAEDLSTMFQLCSSLTSLDVSKWDTSSVTDLSFTFYGTSGLTSIDVSNWNVSKVISFDHMLAHSTNLVDFDTSRWKVTSACTNMYAMFHSTNLTSLDVSGWDTSNCIVFGQCFEGMSYLKELKGLETWDTSSGVCFAQMFAGCSSLTTLNLSNFDTRKATTGISVSSNGSTSAVTSQMFNNMTRLEKIILGENFTFLGDGTTTDSAYLGVLPTPNATYIDGADGSWYVVNGTAYTASNIPNLTANVYYASLAQIDSLTVVITNGVLRDIANAIRMKNGSDNKYYPSDFAAEILKL